MPRALIALLGSTLSLGVACDVLGPFDELPGNTGLIGVDLGAIAVVTGDFDREEELLADRELAFTLYDGWITGPPPGTVLAGSYAEALPTVEQLLSDPDNLEAYDLIFFNCGVRGTGSVDPAVPLSVDTSLLSDDRMDNLRDWVESGGTLFVSDQSYNLLERAFPDLIDFEGDDARINTAAVGGITTLTLEVVDAAVSEAIGSPTVTVDFPVSHWAVPLATGGDVWVRADVPLIRSDESIELVANRPLLVQLPVGLGQVTFSSFHNLPEVDQVRWDLQIQLLRSLRL